MMTLPVLVGVFQCKASMEGGTPGYTHPHTCTYISMVGGLQHKTKGCAISNSIIVSYMTSSKPVIFYNG
jgi:hypothetical protein